MTAARLSTALAVVLFTTAAGCGSSSGPTTVMQTVTQPAATTSSASEQPAPSSSPSDATSQETATDSSGPVGDAPFAPSPLSAVAFSYQGFHYKMEMQTAHLNIDGEDVTLGTPAPHGFVWVVALFMVTNVDDRPIPAIDNLLVPDAQVRERFASAPDRREAAAVDDDNCHHGWCAVRNAVTSGVIEDGQFNATPCSTCTMRVRSDHQIIAAYQVREGLEPDDIRLFVPELAPIGGDYSRASRRLD